MHNSFFIEKILPLVSGIQHSEILRHRQSVPISWPTWVRRKTATPDRCTCNAFAAIRIERKGGVAVRSRKRSESASAPVTLAPQRTWRRLTPAHAAFCVARRIVLNGPIYRWVNLDVIDPNHEIEIVDLVKLPAACRSVRRNGLTVRKAALTAWKNSNGRSLCSGGCW